MKLKDILKGIKVLSAEGNLNCVISSVVFDSRKVEKNCLFVAVRGTKTDGHDFIAGAISSGASAVICEVLPEERSSDICWIKVGDSAFALGMAASNFFGNPSSLLRLTGVTGTQWQNHYRHPVVPCFQTTRI